MLETIISYAGKIADLQNRDDLILLTDSQDVKEILDDLIFFAQSDEYLDDINGLFVSVHDGAYGEIYAFSKSPSDKQESKDDDEEKNIKLFFKVVYVFDISQTEGDDIPELDVWKSPEIRPKLQQRLIDYAQPLCLSVDVMDLGSAQGALTSDHKILLDSTAGTKTLVHEIAHHLAGHLESEKSHEQRELEAEATAYVVCKHFGFEDLKSPNYLYLKGLKAEDLLASLSTISNLTQQIMISFDGDIN